MWIKSDTTDLVHSFVFTSDISVATMSPRRVLVIDMKGHSTGQGFELNGFDCIPRMSLRRRQKYVVPLFLLSAVADEVHRRSTRGPCCGNAWST